jgi:hypothetical protein
MAWCYGGVLDTWPVTNSSIGAFIVTAKQDLTEVQWTCSLIGGCIYTDFET